MKRSDGQRLSDVLVAIDAIARHLQRGALSDPLVFDAVRVRLIEIGEAISHIDIRLLRQSPEIEWREIKNMRNHLAHNYFGTDEFIIAEVVDQQLEPLAKAVNRLLNGKPSSSV
ncbi:MAG: DUF86 domain-containing protein [Actinobacteria bacterium]|nr:DUF86 domain-containing protein [Actinomycetota bacterium]